MTAHRFCYIVATLVAVVGLAIVVFADAPSAKALWGCVFASLGLFELGHWIDAT